MCPASPHTKPTPAILLEPTSSVITAPACIGVYDSRAVAYAYCWSEAGTGYRSTLADEVRAARAVGDGARLRRAETAMHAYDQRIHLAVFSTAPADDALAALGEQLSIVMREAGVTRLIAKSDTGALAVVARARRIDVTDRLVARFELSASRLRTIDALLEHDPIPLQRARALWRAGRL